MTRTTLSDGELAALVARIQQNYDYDDRSGKLVNRKTCMTVRGRKDCKRNGKYRYSAVFQRCRLTTSTATASTTASGTCGR